MRIAAILLASLLVAATALDKSLALSVAVRSNPVSLSEPVTLVVTLRNRSDRPRYVHRNVEAMLDFAVRDADDQILRGFMHPPGMPLMPKTPQDLVRIEGWKAYQCVVEVPLADLGIERAGVFSVFGFWSGTSAKAPTIGAKYQNHFEHAEATYLTVVADKAAAVDSRPTPLHIGLPKCLPAEAGPQSPK